MKNIRLKLLAGLIMLIVAGSASAQDRDQSRKDRKSARTELKKEKAKKHLELFNDIKELIKEQHLVLDANTLQGKYGSVVVATGDNFILIDGDHFVMQTANPNRIGYNGMGGFTAKGTVTDYKYTIDDEKQYISIIAQVSTFGIGQGTLSIHISGPDHATATFRNNWGGAITFNGSVLNPEDATMFQGRSLI